MKNKLTHILKKISIIELLILINPLLDFIVSIGIIKGNILSYFGVILRGATIIIIGLYMLKCNSKYKKISIVFLTILTMFFGTFIMNKITIYKNAYIFAEIKNLFKFFSFPILLIGLININEEKKYIKNIKSDKFAIIGYIYISIIVITSLIGLDQGAYNYSKKGIIGVFNSTNEISSILAILTPIVFYLIYKIKNNFISIGLGTYYIVVLMNIGTKVPLLALIFTNICFFIINLIKKIYYKKENKIRQVLSPIIFLLIIASVMFVFSPIVNNLKWQKEFAEEKYSATTEVPEVEKSEENIISEANDSSQKSKKYQLRRIINLIFSSRDEYVIRTFNIWKKSSITQKLFGMGSINEYGTQNTVEIDFIDIFFNYGIIGFFVYFSVIIILCIKIILLLTRNILKTLCNDKSCAYLLSCALGSGISILSGHVLGAPSVSFIFAIIFISVINEFTEKKSKKSKKRFIDFLSKKSAFIISFVVFIMILITITICIYNKKNTNFFEIPSIININNLQSFKDLNLVSKEKKANKRVKDNIYKYSYKIDNENIEFIMVDRSIDNNDSIKYLTVTNNTNKKIYFDIKLLDFNAVNNFRFDKYKIDKGFSSVVGYDMMSLPIIYSNNGDNSILIGKSYKYRNLNLEYEDEKKSVLKELISEDDDLIIDGHTYKKTVELQPGMSLDTYYYLGEKLFKDEKSIQEYINMLNKNKTSPWITYCGTYSKLPYSIEPFTRDGYGRNVGAMIEKESLKIMSYNESSIFYDMVVSSDMIYSNYMPLNNEKLWYTEYTSTWLKKDYDTIAPYIDTRHNEAIGLFFKELGDYIDEPEISSRFLNYSNYLLAEYKKNNVIKTKRGILFPDYFSEEKATHASLNHQLAIINYLFKCYLEDGNNEYYSLAIKLLDTIEKIGTDWINPDNNDLFYQVDSSYVFTGNDYVFVTLEDLINTQNLMYKINKRTSEVLEKLIESKIKYLNSQDISLPEYIKFDYK